MFDTSLVWAQVLKKLRDNNEHALHGACADLRDIEFTADYVIITAHNQTVYTILKKHLDLLNKYAGGEYIQLWLAKKEANKKKTIEQLQEIFGDKLIVEK